MINSMLNDMFWDIRPGNYSAKDFASYVKDGTLYVELALLGFSKEQVSIEGQGDVVTVSANQNSNQIRHGECERKFRLPKGFAIKKASAELANGILTLGFAPTKENKPTSIEIN